MGANHRLDYVGKSGPALVADHYFAARCLARVDITIPETVHCFEALKLCLHFLRQAVIGGGSTGELGVAKRRAVRGVRYFDRIKDRTAAWRLGIGQVGVPVTAGVLNTDGLAVFNNVGEHIYLWVLRLGEFPEYVHLELSKAAAEIDVLLVRHLLVTEQQHGILAVGRFDGSKSCVVELAGQVHLDYLGPK